MIPVLKATLGSLNQQKEDKNYARHKQLEEIVKRISNEYEFGEHEECELYLENNQGDESESDCEQMDEKITDMLNSLTFNVHHEDMDIEVSRLPDFDEAASKVYGIPIQKLPIRLKSLLEKSFIYFRTDPWCYQRGKYLSKVSVGSAKSDILNFLKYLGWMAIHNGQNKYVFVNAVQTPEDIAKLFENPQLVSEYAQWCVKTRENKLTTVANIVNSLCTIVIWLVECHSLLSLKIIEHTQATRKNAEKQAVALKVKPAPFKCLWDVHIQEAWKRAYEVAMRDPTIQNLQHAILIGFYSLYPTDRVSIIRNLKVKVRGSEKATLQNVDEWIPRLICHT